MEIRFSWFVVGNIPKKMKLLQNAVIWGLEGCIAWNLRTRRTDARFERMTLVDSAVAAVRDVEVDVVEGRNPAG